MIGAAIGAGLQSSAEVGQGEGCDLLLDSQFDGGAVKSGHRGIELRKQILLGISFAIFNQILV